MDILKTAIEAFSGLGLFLFGMIYLEKELNASAGNSFRRLVEKATSTRWRSLLTGFSGTALLQSSSVVTLMALSLIGAGMMGLESAIGIVMGANIGTTVTAWIVGLVGFRMDIGLLSYIFIGVGGLGSVVSPEKSRWKHYFGAMVGFGLIFLGLEGMKESFSVVSAHFDISSLGYTTPYPYALAGLLLTAVIQSSSASIAIAQSALYAGMIGFDTAAAFVVGANIGTTVTAILGAIGGTPDKKRTAMAHLLFNVSTGAIALALLVPLTDITSFILPDSDDMVRIALFHTIFNILGVLIWFPWIEPLSRFLKRLFVRKEESVTKYIAYTDPDLPQLAIEATEKELEHLAHEVEKFALLAINISPSQALEKKTPTDKLLDRYEEPFGVPFDELYDNIRRIEGEIYRYIASANPGRRDPLLHEKFSTLAKKTAYISTAAKDIKDMIHDIEKLQRSDSNEIVEFYRNLRYLILKSVQAFHRAIDGDEDGAVDLRRLYRQISESYIDSIDIIKKIAQNPHIGSEMMAIAVNDMHLCKSFGKSLRNFIEIPGLSETSSTRDEKRDF
jgi:phosphate:Na+ symporter